MGAIGQKVADIAEAFGCKVICYSASGRKYQLTSDRKQVDFDTILQESDVLSIHAPLNSQTENLIDLQALKKNETYIGSH